MRDTQKDILHFWFEETTPEQWFQKNTDFDREITARFASDFAMALQGVYDRMMGNAEGALALIILLDQFPRNMFRDDAKAFSGDAKALEIARHALSQGYDQAVEPVRRRFLYLPFEHSEVLQDQNKSVALFQSMRGDDLLGYEYAVKHREIIEQFGRFPHRNAALGRVNTPEEEAYLSQPGAGF